MKNQVNFSDQEEGQKEPASFQLGNQPREKKFDFVGKLLMTIAIYVSLFCLAVVVLYLFAFANFDPDRGLLRTDFGEIVQTVFLIGVLGVVPIFGGGAAIFDLFPFAFLLGALAMIFFIVSVLEQSHIITKNRERFNRILAVPLFLCAVVFIFDKIIQFNQSFGISQEKDYYQETYETREPVESESRFIYPGVNEESGDILVSGIYEESKEKLFSSGEENIGYISPNGKYFVSCDEGHGRYGDCQGLHVAEDPSKKIDLCQKGASGETEKCPQFCDWDSGSNSLVCSIKNGLLLFNPKTGRQIEILGRAGIAGEVKGFDFLDEDSLIINKAMGGFLKLDDIYSCRPKVTELENLADCESFVLEREGIYCVVRAEEQGIEINDEDNFEVKGYEHFIIRQSLNQASREDFEVINKAPIPETEVLVGVDGKYIFALSRYGGSYKIIETESGLVRDLGGGFEWEEDYMEEDEGIIFKNSEDKKKTPRPYLKSSSDSRGLKIEQCREGRNAGSSELDEGINQGENIPYNSEREASDPQASGPEDLKFGVDDGLIFLDGQERYSIKRLFKKQGANQEFLAFYQIEDLAVVNGFEMAEVRVNLLEEESSTEEFYRYLLNKQQEDGTDFDYSKLTLGGNEYVKRDTSFYLIRTGKYQVSFLIKHPSNKVDWESFEKMLGSLEIKR